MDVPREVTAVSTPLPLLVQARDPLSQAGVVAQLENWPEVRVVADAAFADVAIVVGDEIDEETVRMLKSLQRNGCSRVVLVATKIDDAGLVAAVEAGASGLLRRTDATPAAL